MDFILQNWAELLLAVLALIKVIVFAHDIRIGKSLK